MGNAGEANLNLDNVNLPMGTHTLTLEVSNGVAKASDDMILTIDNSAPHAVPGGAGTYELGTSVTLRGEVSDFDGDQLSYTWKESSNLLTSGTVATIYAGTPVKLPDFQVAGLSLGRHTLTLEATDGVNTPAIQTMEVNIIDTQAPVLAPSVNQSILWPPDHRLVASAFLRALL